jgi:hypothetical protein
MNSPAGSMEGWSFPVWFSKNKDSLKYIVMAVTGIIAGTTWGVTQGGLVAAISRIIMDAIDFYSTKVEL